MAAEHISLAIFVGQEAHHHPQIHQHEENIPAIEASWEIGETQPIELTATEPIKIKEKYPSTVVEGIIDFFEQNGGKAESTVLLEKFSLHPSDKPRSDERIIRTLSQKLELYQKAIRYKRNEEGRLICTLAEIGPIKFPDGTPIDIRGETRREIVRQLLLHQDDGLEARHTHGENTPKLERNLTREIVYIRKIIAPQAPQYSIVGKMKDDEVMRFYLKGIEKKEVSLPNGIEIQGLPTKERAILMHFMNINLPLYMEQLVDVFSPGEELKKAKLNIVPSLSRINKALGENGKIVRVTKRLGTNPAYRLNFAEDNLPKLQGLPTHPLSSQEVKQIYERKRKIFKLLQDQKIGKLPALIDEENEALEQELIFLDNKIQASKRLEKRENDDEENFLLKEWEESVEGKFINEMMETPYSSLISQIRIQYYDTEAENINQQLDKVGLLALQDAAEKFDEIWEIPFDDYARFQIRGAMGNILLHNSPEAPQRDDPETHLPPISNLEEFKKIATIAIVGLSTSKLHDSNAITPDESRILDILLGITGKNPAGNEDAEYEMDVSEQWVKRKFSSGLRKLANSSYGPALANFLHS